MEIKDFIESYSDTCRNTDFLDRALYSHAEYMEGFFAGDGSRNDRLLQIAINMKDAAHIISTLKSKAQ